MEDQKTLYALAICCQEIKPPLSVNFHFSAGYTSAESREQAIGIGISLAKEKWPDFSNHQCEVLEIPTENTRYFPLRNIVKRIGDKMKKPSPDKADHPMVIGGSTGKRNTPEDTAFNDGLLTAEDIVYRVFQEFRGEEHDDARATELEWLQWFHSWADFGPADGDVQEAMKVEFMKETGKSLPSGYYLDKDAE